MEQGLLGAALRTELDGDLEQLQDAILSGRIKPAAKAVRVCKKQTKPTENISTLGDEIPEHTDTKSKTGKDAPQARFGPTLVGDVRERDTSNALATPPPPAAAVFPTGGFPEAENRRISKFALNRKRKAKPIAQARGTERQPVGSEECTSFTSPSRAGGKAAHGDTDAQEGEVAERQASSMLASMGDDEIQEAQAELRGRFDQGTLDFLMRRGAAKLRNVRHPDSMNEGQGSTTSLLPENGSNTAQTPSNRGNQCDGPSRPQYLSAQGRNTRHSVHTFANAGVSATAGATFQEEESAQVRSFASRLRFSSDGSVVGLVSLEEMAATPSAAQRALERDPLRQDEGCVANVGYTLSEACALVHSRVTAQRAYGLRLIAAVLHKCRPSPWDAAPDWKLARRRSPTLQGMDGVGKVSWLDVWEHAIGDAAVVPYLMAALHDQAAGVIIEAAECLCQLLGQTADVDLVFELAEANPFSGWPVVDFCDLQRASPGGIWEQLTAEGASQQGDERSLDVSSGTHPTDLVDQVFLQRCNHILTTLRLTPATGAILSILLGYSHCGVGQALSICSNSVLCNLLEGILSSDRSTARTLGWTDGDVPKALKCQALRLVRSLMQAGRGCAVMLNGRGLLEIAKQYMAVNVSFEPEGTHKTCVVDNVSAYMKLEALRIWRLCCLHDLSYMSFDDAYLLLCRDLCSPTQEEIDAMLEEQESDQEWSCQGSRGTRFLLAREAYLSLDFAIAKSQTQGCSESGGSVCPVVSPGCVEALVKEAESWLEPSVLHMVFSHLQKNSTHDGHSADREWQTVHPAEHLPTCAIALSAVSAVLSCLSIYWSARNGPRHRLSKLVKKSRLVDALGAQWLRSFMGEMCATATKTDASRPENRSSERSRTTCRAAVVDFVAALVKLMKQTQDPTLWTSNQSQTTTHSLLPLLQDAAFRTSGSSGCTTALDLYGIACISLNTRWGTMVSELLELVQLEQPHDQMTGNCLHADDIGTGDRQVICHTSGTADMQASVGQMDLGMHLLTILPPCGETLGLRAISAALHPSLVAPVFEAAHKKAVQQVHAHPALCAAVSHGFKHSAALPQLPAARCISKDLIDSLSASWLSMVAEDLTPSGVVKTTMPTMHVPTPRVSCDCGTRLPLPEDWLLCEALIVPRGESSISGATYDAGIAASDADGNALTPVGWCLLLILGMEECGSRYLSLIPPAQKLRDILHIAFLAQSDELCPGTLGAVEVWQDPWVRWPLAALTELYTMNMATCDAMQTLGDWVNESFAEQLVRQFGSSSFGDPLFARCLTLLMQPSRQDTVVRTSWMALQDQNLLHFLPPMEFWLGGEAAYLRGSFSRKMRSRLLASIQEGHLDKAFAMNSGSVEFAVWHSLSNDGTAKDWRVEFKRLRDGS